MPQTDALSGTRVTVLLATNIHCASCVTFVKETLYSCPSIKHVDVTILTQEVRVTHTPDIIASQLARMLIDAAFEVQLATTPNEAGVVLDMVDTSSWNTYPKDVMPSLFSAGSSSKAKRERELYEMQRSRHIENCEACQKELFGKEKEKLHELDEKSILDSVVVDNPGRQFSELFDARISISGMTCAACTNTVTDALEQLPFVKEVIVTLLTNSATLTYSGPKENIDKVVEEVESVGFEAAIDTVEKVTISDPLEFEAQFSIGGMTCGSCVNSITHHVKQLEPVKDATVNLVTNSANVIFTGTQSYAEKVRDEIESLGYEASLEKVTQQTKLLKNTPAFDRYVANISIGGMTCGACVARVTQGLQELSCVKDVVVDLLSNSAKVEFDGKDNLDVILEEIEDFGYESKPIDCNPLEKEASAAPLARTVMIRVDGMFCHHCPETVLQSLHELDHSIDIVQGPSQIIPIVKVTYTPDTPKLTIRKIVSAIDLSSPAFKASIYHPPSIEDRSREMQLRERRHFLSRLLFVFIVAIPTFLIGIVFTSLVPSTTRIRQYLSDPIWSGAVSRMEWAMLIMTTPVMFYGADVFHIRAMKEIRALWRPGSKVPVLRRFYRFGSMNLLISAGTLVAYLASLAVLIAGAVVKPSSTHSLSTYFDTVTFLTLFILAGRSLEAYSKSKTGDAVSALGRLRPNEALLMKSESSDLGASPTESESSDTIQRIPVDLLEVGDIVNIPHGASPPADGVVVSSGKFQFDESSLTGESRPVSKTTGDQLYSGSVNVGQQVSVRVTELGGTSMLDQIIKVVREGQSKRAPMERIADVLVAYFVPIITLIAILTFVIWLSLGQSGALPVGYLDDSLGGWAFWSLQFAIAVFVVACPCGLALAAPTALFVGIGMAAQRGILVRGGGEAFQEATRLDAIVFDKTGTLTEGGSLKVSEHEVLDTDPEKVAVAWKLAHELEQTSNHPIARAIVEFCQTRSSSSISVKSSDIIELPGQGMKGNFTLSTSGETITYEAAIGNERLVESISDKSSENSDSQSGSYFLSNLLSTYQTSGKSTAVLLLRKISSQSSSQFSPVLVFATSDPIRPESSHVIAELQKCNIAVYMCTGDNERTAHAVASGLGIPPSNVVANVMPAQKAEFIHKVQSTNSSQPGQKKTIVAFVGDGTNDSPALAASDVSIAMSSGSDVAISTSSFILLNSNLNTIFELIVLSRRVFNRIKMNFVWAAVYNLILVPVAAGVFYPIPHGTNVIEHGSLHMTVDGHWRLDPVWASLAMALSSVSVVSSSLALRIEGRAIREFFNRLMRKNSL
ncbi:putative copper resistance-associated P-type ATPase [Talaromyces proteolyticus]|uniref:Copper resistance-associated P-type ATPase n=1 Tax=Talaromyces proteolyticus TaxID=1131652 RepID=A0AAD4PYT3_9EURO|nr:putative copper resistance-associated P-type ATPase [Talaromyces proteolyticus]KAH8695503.1 putative copper resistance-associated P-type ATPase [Talaromyces proteolyticus]